MKYPRNIDPPVTDFERLTSYCAFMLADQVVWEAEVYFHQPMPPLLAERLAQRAERVLKNHSRCRRWFRGSCGCYYIKSFLRHWLSSALAKERPELFRQLPSSFKWRVPVPLEPLNQPKQIRRTVKVPRKSSAFAHGCELLVA